MISVANNETKEINNRKQERRDHVDKNYVNVSGM